eukprot:6486112-Alexandrium_andersonii.AAC.1
MARFRAREIGRYSLASRAGIAKDCADCGLADGGWGFVMLRCCDFGSPRSSILLADSESARKIAQNAPLVSFEDQC